MTRDSKAIAYTISNGGQKISHLQLVVRKSEWSLFSEISARYKTSNFFIREINYCLVNN